MKKDTSYIGNSNTKSILPKTEEQQKKQRALVALNKIKQECKILEEYLNNEYTLYPYGRDI